MGEKRTRLRARLALELLAHAVGQLFVGAERGGLSDLCIEQDKQSSRTDFIHRIECPRTTCSWHDRRISGSLQLVHSVPRGFRDRIAQVGSLLIQPPLEIRGASHVKSRSELPGPGGERLLPLFAAQQTSEFHCVTANRIRIESDVSVAVRDNRLFAENLA